MSRNFPNDKLFKIYTKNTKMSTSVDKVHKDCNLKSSFEISLSTKNSKSKIINYIDIDGSQKKSSSRRNKKNTTLIP